SARERLHETGGWPLRAETTAKEVGGGVDVGCRTEGGPAGRTADPFRSRSAVVPRAPASTRLITKPGPPPALSSAPPRPPPPRGAPPPPAGPRSRPPPGAPAPPPPACGPPPGPAPPRRTAAAPVPGAARPRPHPDASIIK